MCCRNNASGSLISCSRRRSYTRRSVNEQYRITRMHDYRQHATQLARSHLTRYNIQRQYNEEEKLMWTLSNQRPLTYTQPIKSHSVEFVTTSLTSTNHSPYFTFRMCLFACHNTRRNKNLPVPLAGASYQWTKHKVSEFVKVML